MQFPAVLSGLVFMGLCFYYCIHAGRKKGIPLILCIIAGIYNLLGGIIIFLVPARRERGQRRNDHSFSPPGQPDSVREIKPAAPPSYPGEFTDSFRH